MNKAEIVKSPEAERMLQMVTKGFYDRSYIGLWIYEVIGREYDEMAAWARGLRDEIFPQTCTWSIGIWEWVYGIETDETLSLDYRRKRIMTKITERAPMNPETICRNIEILTEADVGVTENTAPYTFKVIINPNGKIFDYVKVCHLIKEIKPSHLAFETMIKINASVNTKTAISAKSIFVHICGYLNFAVLED